MRRKSSRTRELGAERFVERHTIERAHERTDELRHERAVARMPPITRRQELDLGAKDRGDELGHARWIGRRAVGVDDDQYFRLRQLGGGKNRAQRRELARQSVIRRDDAMQRPQRVRRLHHVGFDERRGPDQLRGAVGRSAVGVDHYCAQSRKIAREAEMNRAYHVDDRGGVVEGGQADEDVDLADGHQLTQECVGQSALGLDGCHQSTGVES